MWFLFDKLDRVTTKANHLCKVFPILHISNMFEKKKKKKKFHTTHPLPTVLLDRKPVSTWFLFCLLFSISYKHLNTGNIIHILNRFNITHKKFWNSCQNPNMVLTLVPYIWRVYERRGTYVSEGSNSCRGWSHPTNNVDYTDVTV